MDRQLLYKQRATNVEQELARVYTIKVIYKGTSMYIKGTRDNHEVIILDHLKKIKRVPKVVALLGGECSFMMEDVGETIGSISPTLPFEQRADGLYKIANQTIDTLSQIHARGVIHTDLKSDQITFQRESLPDDNIQSTFYIIDFDVARIDGHSSEITVNNLNERRGVLTSPPEMWYDRETAKYAMDYYDPVDAPYMYGFSDKTDVYQLGMVFLDMLLYGATIIYDPGQRMRGNKVVNPYGHSIFGMPGRGLKNFYLDEYTTQYLISGPTLAYRAMAMATNQMADVNIQNIPLGVTLLDSILTLYTHSQLYKYGIGGTEMFSSMGEIINPARIKSDYEKTIALLNENIELRDLLSLMLMARPESRPSMTELMQHPYLNQ